MGDQLFGFSAVNFPDTLFDTEDLSTIRGASLAAIDIVCEAQPPGFDPVSVGGSSGIWTGKGAPHDRAPSIKRSGTLANAAKHLSFVWAAVPCTADHQADVKALKAALARKQMARASMPYPSGVGARICPVDLVRPAAGEPTVYRGSKRFLSDATRERRAHGLDAKQRFITSLIGGGHALLESDGLHPDRPFAMLLSSISEGPNHRHELRRSLQDKIAVIHIDGNSVSKALEKGIGKGEHRQQLANHKAFDGRLAEMRKRLARSILDVLAGQPATGAVGAWKSPAVGAPSLTEREVRREIKKPAEAVIRFEALLWAGDEMTFIVPARFGWDVVLALMTAIRDPAAVKKEDRLNLTAAIGLVFCHHDAPIGRIRALADQLCSHIKRTDRSQNLVFPLVLESFDHIGGGLGDFLAKRTPQDGALGSAERKSFFILNADEIAHLADQAHEWAQPSSEISRRALRSAAHAFYRAEKGWGCADRRTTMLIEEFWDYFIPCPPKGASEA